MKDLSIVIVNYNVKHFLDQCLRSVFEAQQDLDLEIFVVDNDSVDSSVQHVKEHFPNVKLIENKENIGFSRANNQAIREAKGKYVLLLNPDTIVEKDTFIKCFDYMESNPKCGALGVRMIDGEGKFLPESKRGFPTPFASLMRLLGLSKLFPKSKVFNRYNLGYLSEFEVHEIDVLCGAFMFMRKEALEEVGLLDEKFFMYGEDIDLSYRIQKADYTVIYLPSTSIVHFKGESTKKSSLKYYSTFYNAMAIFAKKHYGGSVFNPFLWMVNTAIIMIAMGNLFIRFASTIIKPVFDFLLVVVHLLFIEYLWARFYHHDPGYYDEFNSIIFYLIYGLIWVVSLWLSGSYKSFYNFRRYFWGILGGSLVVLIFYALLDDEMRHSRAIILLSVIMILVSGIILRALVKRFRHPGGVKELDEEANVLVVGNEDTIEKAKEILKASLKSKKLIGALSVKKEEKKDFYLQSLDRIEQVIDVYKIDEVLFSAEQVPMEEIMKWMTRLGAKVKVKIISRDVQSIIGSHDRNSRGDLYTVELNYRINQFYNRLLKLFLDYSLSLLITAFSPLIVLFSLRLRVFKNLYLILLRQKSYVSYFAEDQQLSSLPVLPEAIIPPLPSGIGKKLNQEEMHSINFYYARDFNLGKDLEIIILNFHTLIRKLSN